MQVPKAVALFFVLALSSATFARAQTAPVFQTHDTEEWARIAPHLPDPTVDTPAKLEVAGDVLRARRFPDDALTFYKAAALRGGDPGRLLKKEGVAHMQLQHGLLAHLCFEQSVHFNKRDAQAWNDLGASDFMLGNSQRAVSEYKRAVRLDRDSAVYHSNLSIAYFESRDTRKARKELVRALAMDPDLLHRTDSGGFNLQVLASSHYAEICFEMARAYAGQNDRENAVAWLAKASERGFPVRSMLNTDALLTPLLQDPRVQLMLQAQDERHDKEMARVKTPSLPAQTP